MRERNLMSSVLHLRTWKMYFKGRWTFVACKGKSFFQLKPLSSLNTWFKLLCSYDIDDIYTIQTTTKIYICWCYND